MEQWSWLRCTVLLGGSRVRRFHLELCADPKGGMRYRWLNIGQHHFLDVLFCFLSTWRLFLGWHDVQEWCKVGSAHCHSGRYWLAKPLNMALSMKILEIRTPLRSKFYQPQLLRDRKCLPVPQLCSWPKH